MDTFKSRRPWNRGRCPMCRAPVSLYNTKMVGSGEVLLKPPVDTIFGQVCSRIHAHVSAHVYARAYSVHTDTAVYIEKDSGSHSLYIHVVAFVGFGQVYMQLGSVGQASYHFDMPDDCYISYANAPAEWPALANGEQPPAKKPFLDPKFDPATRTFTGTIDWAPSGGWDGDCKWEYRMVFQDDSSTLHLLCALYRQQ